MNTNRIIEMSCSVNIVVEVIDENEIAFFVPKIMFIINSSGDEAA